MGIGARARDVAVVVPGVLGSASRRIMTPRARSLRLSGPRRETAGHPRSKASGAPRIENAEVERRKASWSPQDWHVLPRRGTLRYQCAFTALRSLLWEQIEREDWRSGKAIAARMLRRGCLTI